MRETDDQTAGLWLTAGLAVVALILWAAIDALRTTFAMGAYEDQIDTVTHGNVSVLPAYFAYALLSDSMSPGTAHAVANGSWWTVGPLVAAAAFITWLYQARRNAGRRYGALEWTPGWAIAGWFIPLANLVIPYLVVRDVRRASGRTAQQAPIGRWWTSVLLTVLFSLLIWLYPTISSKGGVFHGTALDTRSVAYPLWTVGTVSVVVTAVLTARVVWRITEGTAAAPS